jgi:hypothetical protein
MGERWFSKDELEQMSRPTMERAIEALDRGDVAQARELCEQMKHEWRYLHDLMVEGIAGLISFVQERLGDDGVAEAWTEGQGGAGSATLGPSPAAIAKTSCTRWRRRGARTPAAAQVLIRAHSRSPKTTRSSPSR